MCVTLIHAHTNTLFTFSKKKNGIVISKMLWNFDLFRNDLSKRSLTFKWISIN